ncbi:FtsW/RodA/SpoVE family cell cycle protein [Paenibacillus cymbidii]|uniref:FtsW/RodA/SpoVE family cell cycle protein n=1 Tax=Paenibacillus cymbidii TaxID=1639034 RepID=UPI001081DF0E|nr:FtsW/RodA/SpoVE family cell cycle protein [Paenibacillus cymbidii]
MFALVFGKVKKIDWTIVAILLVMAVVGTLLVYTTTINSQLKGFPGMYKNNVINYVLGFIVFVFMSMFNYRLIVHVAKYLYLFGIGLLIAVYFLGSEINHAKGWFKLPFGFNFQPAELMKFIVIIALAAFLSRKKGEQLQFLRDVVPIGLIVFVPFALVMMQPDLGNAIIFLVVLLGMYWIGNIKYWHVLIGLVVLIGGFVLFMNLYTTYHDNIKQYLGDRNVGYWMERIDAIVDPQGASEKATYQGNNSKVAIGSGMLKGEGFTKGVYTQQGRVPYAYSDAVFSALGEEFGFIGGATLLLLYFILIYRMILISIQSSDLSGSYIIVGIVSMYVFQIFENVGMMIGLMPITGITLPFISYGGTSLLINMLSLGLVTSIHVHRETVTAYNE